MPVLKRMYSRNASSGGEAENAEAEDQDHKEKDTSKNNILIKSQECIQRMEIASLSRYVIFQKSIKSKEHTNLQKCLLFFTPCEELNGGSCFSRTASNYNVI